MTRCARTMAARLVGVSASVLLWAATLAAGQQQESQGEPSVPEPPVREVAAGTLPWGGSELPLAFADDFAAGRDRWQLSDEQAWDWRATPAGRHLLGLNRRISAYQPTVRSPHNIALVRELQLNDFVLTVDVRNVADTGGHRDCCIFFGYRSPTEFYYAHLGAKPDPASGQIMLVNNADRRPLSENKNEIPWDNAWHQIRVTRDSQSGAIAVFFDDLQQSVMTATDRTFGLGQLGLGSFDDQNDFANLRIYGR